MMLQLPISNPDFARRLLDWYNQHKRALPWRGSTDPYRIWVSEIMLQQTQVKAVLPYFEKFLGLYPRLEDLARAEDDEVLSAWSGLGYYSRARNLHKAAQLVCEQHGGTFPSDFEQAIRLPGIGRYTAGAILSIALGQALPVLDGNIRRVFVRYLKIEEELRPAGQEKLWLLLGEVVRDPAVSRNIRDFNQALMELGALVCTPRQPKCDECPLSRSCRARKAGVERMLPARRTGRATQVLHYAVALISRDGKFLLRRNEEESFLKGFWEFPRVEGEPNGQVRRSFGEIHGLDLEVVRALPSITHTITFRKLHFHPFVASLKNSVPGGKFHWVTPGQSRYPVSAYVKKILQE